MLIALAMKETDVVEEILPFKYDLQMVIRRTSNIRYDG